MTEVVDGIGSREGIVVSTLECSLCDGELAR